MLRKFRGLWMLGVAALICSGSMANAAKFINGEIIGKTGELLQIKVAQPVKDGTIFQVKSILADPPIAEAKTVSCTKEWPYVVLAKIMLADPQVYVPMGATAFADESSIKSAGESGDTGVEVPSQHLMGNSGAGDGDRFSIQVGSFYPRLREVRNTVADYWQAYRLNYSFIKLGRLDTTISAEYTKGSGSFKTDQGTVKRSLEVVPITALAQFRLARLGSTNLIIGGGGGVYRVRSQEDSISASTSSCGYHFGREFSAGLMSRKGWAIELRYRQVPDTQVEGLSLALGGRF